MRKILSTLAILSTLLVSLFFAPSTKAAPIFFDSFSGGYNHSLWTLASGQVEPAVSDFGIKAGDPSNYSSLIYSNTLPKDLIIKVDMKINSSSRENPASDMGIFVQNSSTSEWKNIFLFGIANGGTPNTAIIRDSSIWGSPSLYAQGPWDTSVGVHRIEVHISGNPNTPITIIEDEQQILTWTSNLNLDFNQIVFGLYGINSEFANFQVCDTEGCPPEPTPTLTPSPTPTSTPTPTPTNTPTPTMTPTPVPSQPKKVILLHGMGGSWNKDALLNCKSTNYAGAWSPWKISDWDIYQPLISNLNQAGYAAIPYYYDWRQNVTNTAGKLNSFIADKTTANEEVDIVGHSLGGLVGRAYLESTQANSHINNLITVGSPHQGSVFSYPAWSGGEMWIDNTQMRLGFTIMKVGCALRRGWSAREMVNNMMFSIQNTLPVFDYLKNTTGAIKPVSGMIAKNNWLPTSFSSPYYNTTVGTITGIGHNTLRLLEVQNASRSDQRLGNWRDGKPTNNRTYADGDGTVLAESTQLPGAQNISLPLDHGALIYDPSGINAIIDFLNGQPALQPLNLRKQKTKIIKPSKEISALMVIVDGARATLTDKDGNETKDSDGQITILNPHQKAYTLTLNPQNKWWWKNSYKVIVVQLFEDGSSKWKEYDRHDFLKKRFKIRFDSKHRSDDIMHDK